MTATQTTAPAGHPVFCNGEHSVGECEDNETRIELTMAPSLDEGPEWRDGAIAVTTRAPHPMLPAYISVCWESEEIPLTLDQAEALSIALAERVALARGGAR